MPEDSFRENVASLLARVNAFPALGHDDLGAIAQTCSWLSVIGGTTLFRQGAESDAIYLVVTGILGVFRQDDGRDRLVGRIGAGEIVGEMGFVTGEPRSATVKALRNSELLRISKGDFQQLAARYPTVLLRLCGFIVRRLRSAQSTPVFRPKTLCLVPHEHGVDLRPVAQQISAAFASPDATLVLSRDEGGAHTADWFFDLEERRELVIYLGEPAQGGWTRFCLGQADTILLLAQGSAEPAPFRALGQDHAELPEDIPSDLALLWDGRIVPGRTAAWLKLVKPRAHHHLRAPGDVQRAVRLMTGRALGLVLSGGGARGLAHLGVIRALQDYRIPIDAVGGTSIGAVIGAGLALEWDVAAMSRSYAEAFLRGPRLSDFAVSRTALFPGRRLDRVLADWFDDIALEEMPVRYFCVSTDLSTGRLGVHTRGRLATWLRASAAIPGVFPPVLDGRAVHVDGGVLNNLPTDVMRELGVTSVVAVDVGSETYAEGDGAARPAQAPGVLDLLWRVGTISSDAKVGAARRQCDVLLLPRVGHIGLLHWRSHEEAIQAGYRVALEHLPEIESLTRR